MVTARWDVKSHQPYPLPRARKRELRAGRLREHFACLKTVAARLRALPQACRDGHWQPPPPAPRDFCGLAVGLNEGDVADQYAVLADLPCRHLLLRIPAWHHDRLGPYLDLLAALPERRWLIAILQDRRHTERPAQWQQALERIIGACRAHTRWFQIGQAPNRIKWGCASPFDYHRLVAVADHLRRQDPHLRLSGPAVLDFEPLALANALALPAELKLDACTLGLYVDRRGSPRTRQAGCFDLPRKIAILAAIARAMGTTAARLWISEVNWPLAGVGDHAPAGPEYRVDEQTYARYMLDYLRLAHGTGLVERVYWWQPIAKGYGLVDGFTGRRRLAFHALQQCLSRDSMENTCAVPSPSQVLPSPTGRRPATPIP